MAVEALDVAADRKAGYCVNCRSGRHGMCTSVRCQCSSGSHYRRPKSAGSANGGRVRPGPRSANGTRPAAPLEDHPITPPPAGGRKGPTFELVKADPPAPKPKVPKLVELVRPMLEQILVAKDRDWYRVAIYPSKTGASMARGRLVKRFGSEWEWQAASIEEVDQSAVYVRWVGDAGTQL